MSVLTKDTVEVHYVADMTVMDIQPPAPFDTWVEADQFLSDLQQNETVSRWVIGLAALRLPAEDPHHSFQAWCRRSNFNPGRVAVWRRMAELYDLDAEVKRFPTLAHKHFEDLMGRASKAKAARAKGDPAPYKTLLDDLTHAADNNESSDRMMARILEREGKSKDRTELPLKLDNAQCAFAMVNIGTEENPHWARCMVLVPKSRSEADLWEQQAAEHGILNEVTQATIARMDT